MYKDFLLLYNGVAAKGLECQFWGPEFKTTEWLQGRPSRSSFRG